MQSKTKSALPYALFTARRIRNRTLLFNCYWPKFTIRRRKNNFFKKLPSCNHHGWLLLGTRLLAVTWVTGQNFAGTIFLQSSWCSVNFYDCTQGNLTLNRSNRIKKSINWPKGERNTINQGDYTRPSAPGCAPAINQLSTHIGAETHEGRRLSLRQHNFFSSSWRFFSLLWHPISEYTQQQPRDYVKIIYELWKTLFRT